MELYLGLMVSFAALCGVSLFLYFVLKSPFEYPYFCVTFDITGKRNVMFEDYADDYLRNEQNWQMLLCHQHKIQEWKIKNTKYLETCKLKKYRTRQYNKAIDDVHAYRFIFIRVQTRYKQQNYVRTSYTVDTTDFIQTANWVWLYQRHKKLEEIGFESTLREYHSREQRKNMTPALRKSIMSRDNYTCQICGKYMPDEVGLHIDHIIPIAKGGKSVPSNLRVLCSKCNGRKGSK